MARPACASGCRCVAGRGERLSSSCGGRAFPRLPLRSRSPICASPSSTSLDVEAGPGDGAGAGGFWFCGEPVADIAEVTRLIEPAAEAEGLALVRVKMIGGTSDPTLQVMAERPDTRQLTLEDCARLSRRLSELLDALEEQGADPIEDSYRLEVSSPGIDRPLTRLSDYDDWKGHEARIHPNEPHEGRKQLSGA